METGAEPFAAGCVVCPKQGRPYTPHYQGYVLQIFELQSIKSTESCKWKLKKLETWYNMLLFKEKRQSQEQPIA